MDDELGRSHNTRLHDEGGPEQENDEEAELRRFI